MRLSLLPDAVDSESGVSQRLTDVVVKLAVENVGDTWRDARRHALLGRLVPVEVLRLVSVELGDEWAEELYQRSRPQPVEIDVADVTHVGDEESTLGWLIQQLLALRESEPGAVFMRVAIGRRELDATGVSVVRRGADAVVLIR